MRNSNINLRGERRGGGMRRRERETIWWETVKRAKETGGGGGENKRRGGEVQSSLLPLFLSPSFYHYRRKGHLIPERGSHTAAFVATCGDVGRGDKRKKWVFAKPKQHII